MARINIESSVYKEIGFQDLMIFCGSRRLAKGTLTELYELAQEYWFPHRKPIPKQVFEEHEFPAILYGPRGLCILKSDGIYVRGSEKAFQWLFDKVSAGQKSAEARKEKFGTAQPPKKKRPETPEQCSNTVQQTSNTAEHARTSLLLSPSSFLSSPNSNLISQNYSVGDATTAHPADLSVSKFIGIYVKAFQRRFGNKARPDLSPKVQGQIKAFLKGRPIERSCDLIQTYFQMEDKWFQTKAYDFTTFTENIQKISISFDTGQEIKPKDGADEWLEKQSKGALTV